MAEVLAEIRTADKRPDIDWPDLGLVVFTLLTVPGAVLADWLRLVTFDPPQPVLILDWFPSTD